MALFFEFLAQQWLLVAALLAVVIMLFMHETRKSGTSLTPQQAINLVNAEDGVFVDLRDTAEFRAGHIVDAMHVPTTKLMNNTGLLENYRDKPIVLVCKMGQSAGAVGKKLNAEGYAKVNIMTGGMMEWKNLQLPVVNNG
ncbi:sulfurtransferase [Halioglobus japonicus]|uniref:Rhodanese-like domain-containing protein n=1 Tax=Halioglobus japonicus TaxID=930805 RepID=A0AAP8SMC5_9GAMM|nr:MULTISPECIES: rhodanese-like domain-containing protein [Halioglobus]AQA17470.1 sulfurtransferase [Halioglobus japonicus]KZX56049.1 sulfurtransferase [Halioglobus sp. HI00S01]PLW85394.1 rhodanese-like domain-containing protein [Halioglobus japonicus]GHD15445.1 sulfurtransferase [Halioglobus japonicus]